MEHTRRRLHKVVIDMDPEVFHAEITIHSTLNSIKILIQRAVCNCILLLGSLDSFHEHTTRASFI